MIRTSTTLLILLLFCINSFAQQIPNGSFELWSGGEPMNWSTSNQNIPFLGTITTVSKELSDPRQGINSAKLKVVKFSIPLAGTYNLPGVLTLGKLNIDVLAQTATVTGGYPFVGKPQKLSGYFKYQPEKNDRCVIGLGLFKWNNGKQDTLAFGSFDTIGTINTWSRFEVPIQYLINDNPDTINIVILNSNPLDGIDHSGTQMWVDNLMLEYGTVGIEGITSAKDLQIYAGPHSSQLILSSSFENQQNLDISLFNMAGAETRHWKSSMKQSTEYLDINGLTPGTYVIRISSGSRLIDTRKITIIN